MSIYSKVYSFAHLFLPSKRLLEQEAVHSGRRKNPCTKVAGGGEHNNLSCSWGLRSLGWLHGRCEKGEQKR